MDTFESPTSSSSSSSNNVNTHRNAWNTYPPDCYSAGVEYYRPYGAARKSIGIRPDRFQSNFSSCLQRSARCLGLSQANTPSRTGQVKHHRRFHMHPLIRHLLMRIPTSCRAQIQLPEPHRSASRTILPPRRKISHTTHYSMPRLSNSINSNKTYSTTKPTIRTIIHIKISFRTRHHPRPVRRQPQQPTINTTTGAMYSKIPQCSGRR